MRRANLATRPPRPPCLCQRLPGKVRGRSTTGSVGRNSQQTEENGTVPASAGSRTSTQPTKFQRDVGPSYVPAGARTGLYVGGRRRLRCTGSRVEAAAAQTSTLGTRDATSVRQTASPATLAPLPPTEKTAGLVTQTTERCTPSSSS